MKVLLAKILLALPVAAALGAMAGPSAAQPQPVTLGAIEILTGPNAHYGTAIRNGLELALAEVNARGGVLGGQPLALIVEDSAGNIEQGINAARKLIGQDRVALIIGPTLSTEMFAVGPIANERKVPIIGTSTTARGITDIGLYVFRTSLPEAAVIPVTLRTAQQKFNIRRVAVMYGNDDAFTRSGYEVFRDTLEKMGIETLTTETFGGRDTDFSAQLTRIQSLNPDAVVVSALVEAAAGILLQARQLGLTQFFIGGNGFNSPRFGEIAGEAADGTLVDSPCFIGKEDPANQAFVAAFRARYGKDPDQFAAQAYDTLFIAAEAIDRAGGTDGDRLREALLQSRHTGVMGPFTFTQGRDPGSVEGVVVLTMQGGKFTILH